MSRDVLLLESSAILPPLIPKLRGHLAEFLQGDSLIHLGILYQPTCVGLEYGMKQAGLTVDF
jgi:hypothetical protein